MFELLFFRYATTELNPATSNIPATNCSNSTHNCTSFSPESLEQPIFF